MTKLDRLVGLFLLVFFDALGIEYAPDGIRVALGAASFLVFVVWFLGYIDLKEMLNGVKAKEKEKPGTEPSK